MAKHSGLPVELFDELRFPKFVHAHTFPAMVLPKHMIQGAEKDSNVVLHGRTTCPVGDSDVMFLIGSIPIFLLESLPIVNLFYVIFG